MICKNICRVPPLIPPALSPECQVWGALGGRLPNQADLVMYTRPVIDSIGESTLDVTVGAGGDFVDMTFSFPSNTDTLAIDTDLGGDVLFDSGDSMAPFSRTWSAWFALVTINVDYLWIGQKGVAGYSTDQSANSAQIESVLNCVAPTEYMTDVDGNPITDVDGNPITVIP